MIDFMVRWILKVTRFTGGILLGSGQILMGNTVLGVLSYHIVISGKFVPQIILHTIKHYFQVETTMRIQKLA